MAFSEFPTQRQVVKLLQRSLDGGRLSHAYLFIGSGLEDLERMAETLAKALNCLDPPRRGKTGLPLDCCDRCLSCRKIQTANHPDVRWVRPESKSRVITIDQMRELMQTIFLKPTEANWKVAVIVAADRLNVHAANSFLKTLEEPPPRSILILLTTDPQRVLETIVSRCLRMTFAGEHQPQSSETSVAWVTQFSEMASGEQKGLLNRYRLLNLLLTRLALVKAGIEKNLSARSPLERYDEVEPRLKEKWEDELAASIEAEYRRQRAEVLLTLQWWLRDVWLHKLTAGLDLFSFPNLAPSAQAVARRINAEDALENLNLMERAQRMLATNVQEALALEVSLLKLKL